MAKEKTYQVDLNKVVFPDNFIADQKEQINVARAQLVTKGVNKAEAEKAIPFNESQIKIAADAVEEALQRHFANQYTSPQRRGVVIPPTALRRDKSHLVIKLNSHGPFETTHAEMDLLFKALRDDQRDYDPLMWVLDYLEGLAGKDFVEKTSDEDEAK